MWYLGTTDQCSDRVADKTLFGDTALRSRRTTQLDSQLPRVCRHGARLPLKLSLSRNGPVLEKICSILVQPKQVQNDGEHRHNYFVLDPLGGLGRHILPPLSHSQPVIAEKRISCLGKEPSRSSLRKNVAGEKPLCAKSDGLVHPWHLR